MTYDELPEELKQKDRDEVMKYWPLIESELKELSAKYEVAVEVANDRAIEAEWYLVKLDHFRKNEIDEADVKNKVRRDIDARLKDKK